MSTNTRIAVLRHQLTEQLATIPSPLDPRDPENPDAPAKDATALKEELQLAVAAWHRAGDLLADLAELDPSAETLDLGGQWVLRRPPTGLPTRDQIERCQPMLIAHGRMASHA